MFKIMGACNDLYFNAKKGKRKRQGDLAKILRAIKKGNTNKLSLEIIYYSFPSQGNKHCRTIVKFTPKTLDGKLKTDKV